MLCDQKRHFTVCFLKRATTIRCDMKNIENIFHLWKEINDIKTNSIGVIF